VVKLDEEMLNRRTPVLTGHAECPVMSRFIARAIDALVISAIFLLLSVLGRPLAIFVAAAYAVLQDAFGAGQSIGKRIIGLRVIDDATGLPCSFAASFFRNVPFLLWVVFGSISSLWGFWALLALPLVGFEIYLLFVLDSGARLGDVLGNTRVSEQVDLPMTPHS